MEKRHRVLVVDDEPLILDLLKETLKRRSFEVNLVDRGEAALKTLESSHFDLIITDVKLPDVNGMDILRRAKNLPDSPGVIMITAYGTIKHAVEAMKEGAFDYITKPFEIDELEITLDRFFRVRRLEREVDVLRRHIQDEFALEGIIGKSAAMQQVFEAIQMVAATNSTVLIRGESGTGKEMVARAIHALSPRKKGPFVRMNCAAMPETLVDTELFGHEKGAFTGAVGRKDGRFKAAHKGSILLDEISEMGFHLQAKLLRVLQEKEVAPIGSNKTERVDVRIMATTNQPLEEWVKQGKFREDLFYRLNVVPIHLPPLRERKEDIPLLVRHFVEKLCAINGLPKKEVDKDVYKLLQEYDWPGNVRQLENAIERALVINKGDVLKPSHFGFLEKEMGKMTDEPSNNHKLVGVNLRELEKKAILDTLAKNKGNRTKTAQELGISVRTLRNKLKEYRENNEVPEEYQIWVYESKE